ncbi:MAG: hypothetical protein LBM96_02390 [Methanobrevibacter sp.]|nr:hypothetical protein [Candidatus Methanoflexus mossambicus]
MNITESNRYEFVEVTDNYAIYRNKANNRSVALIFDENKNAITKISCDNELINLLANSFILKSFNTKGLKIENIVVKNTDFPQTGKSTPKNPNKFVKNGNIYIIEDGVDYVLTPDDPRYDEEIKKYR